MKLALNSRKTLQIILLLIFVHTLTSPVLAQSYDVNNTGVSDVSGLTGGDVLPATGGNFGTVQAIADTNNAYALFGDGSNIQISGDVPAGGIINAQAGNNGAYGLYTNSGTIQAGALNGTITATAGGESAYGLLANNSISIGDVNGTISALANSYAYGLRSETDSILVGTIIGRISATATADSAYGLLANNSITTGNITGTIETNANSNAYSLRTTAGSITTSVIDGTISAIADTNSAYGFYSNTTIDTGNINGTISASAGNNDAYALFANGNITIGDVNGTIEASANLNAYGLRSYTGLIDTGAIKDTITVTSSTDYAYGLSAYTSIETDDINGVITIDADNSYAYGLSSNSGSISTGNIGGTIKVTTGADNAYGINAGDAIIIGNIVGDVNATAGTDSAYGIRSSSGAITIGDISGRILGRTGTSGAYGVFSADDQIATGDISGVIYGRSDANDAFGLYSYGGTLNTGTIDGNVFAYAVGHYAYGILSYGAMDITIDGGYVVGYAESDSNDAAAIQSGRLESHSLVIQDADDRVEIVAGSRIVGDIDLGMAGSDNDILTLSGVDSNTTLNDDLKNIETINLTGGTWYLNGTVSDSKNGINMTGGVLGGTGTLCTLNVTGGTIAPGNSIGTTTINGNFTIDTGATLEIELDNSGNSDKLVVNGDATINGGTLKAITTQTISNTHEYTIIEANNISGQFDVFDTALLQTIMSQYSADLGYSSDTVVLTVIPEQFDNADYLQTTNQLSLGTALQQIAESGGNAVTTALQNVATLQEVRDAYDQLSGQTRTSLASASSIGNKGFTDLVSGRLNNTHSGVAMELNDSPVFAMAQPDGAASVGDTDRNLNSFAMGNGTRYFASENWGLWFRGYGVFGEKDSQVESPGYKYKFYGTGFGMDVRVSEEMLLGISGGFSDGSVNYSSSRDESDITSTPISLYGSWFDKSGYIDSVFTYAAMDYETTRYVDLTSEKLQGEFEGTETSAYFEAGRNLYFGKDFLIQPMASIQFSYLNLDSYTETGGASALTFDKHDYQSYKGAVGMKVKTHLGEYSKYESLTLEVRGRWLHEFSDSESNVNANFASNPSAIFKVNDKGLSRESAIFGIGLRQIKEENVMYYIDYDTNINEEETSHIISAGLRYRW